MLAHEILRENIASEIMEFQQKLDTWFYIVDTTGELFFPSEEKPEPIKKHLESNTSVGKAELAAVDRMEEWARERATGAILWISPLLPQIGYNMSKYQIGILTTKNGEKRLNNVAILTHHTDQECLEIGRAITYTLSSNKIIFFNSEALRANPIPIEVPVGTNWADVLSQHIPAPNAWERIKKDIHSQEKEKARQQAEEYISKYVFKYVFPQNHTASFSCPPGFFTASELFLANSRVYWEYHHGTCRLCRSLTEVGPCNICKTCEKKF